ncbi:MAG: methylmalonyl-CoA mutase family protein, partial [Planctomycetota bacterium]
SYFVESTTNEMERRIVALMDDLDARGGIVKAVAEGVVQAEVNRQAYARERRLLSGEVEKVGVNCFQEEEEEPPVAFHAYDEDEAVKQIERLARVRAERDGRRVEALLGEVETAARQRRNVMPSIMDAVEAYATVGEVCGVLKGVFGTYREPVRF